jgi:hypothetical protein
MADSLINFNNDFNFNNVFFRMLSISLARTLNRRIRWINYFKDEKICVTVPMYLKMIGSERFLLDSYLDDITDQRVELNTDIIPRGIIQPTSYSVVSDEFANPNIYIPKNTWLRDKYTKIITKVRAIPIRVSYDIEIKLDSERDIFKCSEKILDLFFNHFFFNMDFFGIKIDNVLELPDDRTIKFPDEIPGLDADTEKSLTFTLEVRSHYPSWMVDTDEVECDNTEFENIKRVYWKSYIHDMDKLEDIDNLPTDPNDRPVEDFDKTGDFQADNPDYEGFEDTSSTGITWG